MSDFNQLAERYVAVWNEPDADRRRLSIAALWVEDGEHYTRVHDVRGHAALEERVRGAYSQFVGTGAYVFRSASNANGHHGTVRFNWEMVAPDGRVAARGFDFLVLAQDGRIRIDYQFTDPTPPS
jgi:hypothetical protein